MELLGELMRMACAAAKTPFDKEKYLKQAVDMVAASLKAERVLLALRSPKTGGVRSLAAIGYGLEEVLASAASIASIAGGVLEKGAPVVTLDRKSRDRHGDKSPADSRPRTVLCVPLRAGGRILGFIYADRLKDAGPFDDKHLKIMTGVAEELAPIISKMKL
jgi:GAF domain-containing protein